jgi:hypothetical protein
VFVALFRLADGLIHLNYYRSLDLSLDLPLLPELARLMRSTVPLPALIGGGLGGIAALAALTWLAQRALAGAGRFLAAAPAHRGAFAAVVLLFAAISTVLPAATGDGTRLGAFGASVVPELAEQVAFVRSAAERRRRKGAEIQAMQERLAALPAGLERLRGADVFLFLVESYGNAVLGPRHASRMTAIHRDFAADLDAAGYAVVSCALDSSTYGGGSWLAHATLATGLRVGDGLEFAVLRQAQPHPRTMAWYFQQAGYRTVLVQPGTTRRFPEGEVHGFERKYYAPDLGYRGPAFGWATMPDQYVLEAVHRREVAAADRPLFVEYALVSSHAPWTVLPPVVDDWSRLQDGRLYRELPVRRFKVRWDRLGEGGPAYLETLAYDFAVLGRYLARLAPREALVIVMGDHQAAGSVTDYDPSPAVPVHVISRNRALLALFDGPAYASGLLPPPGQAPAGMETLLPELLARLSRPAQP